MWCNVVHGVWCVVCGVWCVVCGGVFGLASELGSFCRLPINTCTLAQTRKVRGKLREVKGRVAEHDLASTSVSSSFSQAAHRSTSRRCPRSVLVFTSTPITRVVLPHSFMAVRTRSTLSTILSATSCRQCKVDCTSYTTRRTHTHMHARAQRGVGGREGRW